MIIEMQSHKKWLTFPDRDSLLWLPLCTQALRMLLNLHGTWNFHPLVFQSVNQRERRSRMTKLKRCQRKASLNIPPKERSTSWLAPLPTCVSNSLLELWSSSSKAWAWSLSCIKALFSFVICSSASDVSPEASMA